MTEFIFFILTWLGSGLLAIILYNIFDKESPYSKKKITINNIISGIISIIFGCITLTGILLLGIISLSIIMTDYCNKNKNKVIFRWGK